MQATLNNLDGAVQFIQEAENKHPNRYDVCSQGTSAQNGGLGTFDRNPLNTTQAPSAFTAPMASPFAAPASTASASGFGQPSALGQKSNPFGSPAFGQASQLGAPGTSAFGKPSPFAAQGSAFGQPSQPGSTGTSAFGQPSQLGGTGTSAFGQPSQLGNTGTSAFGQPSQLGSTGTSAFGQASALGAKPNPFASQTGPSGFAQAAQQQQSAFGQASTMGQNANPFGTPAAASPFAAASQAQNPAPANPFGQPAQPSSFGQPPAPANPFAAAVNNANTSSDQAMDTAAPTPGPTEPSNPFSQAPPSGFGAPAPPQSNPFAQASAPVSAPGPADQQQTPYRPGSTKQHPPLESYATKVNGRLAAFKGQAVTYKEGVPGVRGMDGSWRKIWFPNGPPRYNKDTEPNPEKYGVVKMMYEAMAKNGRFEGDMPVVPPMREDCLWDF